VNTALRATSEALQLYLTYLMLLKYNTLTLQQTSCCSFFA